MGLVQETRKLNFSCTLVDDALVLVAVQGHEALSQLFQYRLELLSENTAIDPAVLLGTNVTFNIELTDGSRRYFNGFVNRFSGGSEASKGRRSYFAEVVPWLWFLTCRTDCRIFQRKSVVKIIEQVFGDLGFHDFEMSGLTGHHPEREYCVQYRESDFQFISRLAEEEGIFWYFRHENGKHTLVLGDQCGAYFDLPENLVDFPRDHGTTAIEDHITNWNHHFQFRTGRWAQTDYNFKTPQRKLMTNESTTVRVPSCGNYEFYDYPGLYELKEDGRALTRCRIEEEEAKHDIVEATSLCKTFSPGGRFSIREHLVPNESGKSYVIRSVRHSARETTAYETGDQVSLDYENRIECIPSDVVYRHPRTTPRPIVEGPQTAVVVGPAGEEIFTDEHGRVKVQFHWDREGRYDENSSCWIRVSQTHAGQRWGAMDLPRIGEEVIVDYLEGNPDRPVISGRVYNGQNTPPFSLPGEKTRSGMKSQTHKGQGSNEISMDDTAGKEQIRTNAQYNMDTAVGNNQTLIVNVDRTEQIGNNDSLTVGVDSAENVGNNKQISVGNNLTANVGKKLVVNAGSSITLKCGASRIHMNSGGVVTITGTIITTAAAANAVVAAPMTQVVGGVMLTTVGGINMMTGGVCKIAAAALNSVSGGKVDVVAAGETKIKGGVITLN